MIVFIIIYLIFVVVNGILFKWFGVVGGEWFFIIEIFSDWGEWI